MIHQFAGYTLDENRHELRLAGETIPVEPKVFQVLLYLLTHRDRVVSKEELLDQCWPNTFVTESALTRCLTKLRRAVYTDDPSNAIVKTVHRQGYRFVAEVEDRPQSSQHVPPSPATPEPAANLQAVPPAQQPSPLDESVVAPAIPVGSSHLAFQPDTGLFVGRESELTQLQHVFATAREGLRQVVFVTGEAGIGKTTLIDAFVATLSVDSTVHIGHGQCIEQYGAGEAYLPLLEALRRLCRGTRGPHFINMLTHHAPSWVTHMPGLVSEEAFTQLQQRSGGATRERMLRELAEAIELLTAEQPLVLVLEDLHWSDASTLEWLAYVTRRRDPARLMILGTYRPVEALAHDHPLRRVSQELQRYAHCAVLPLNYLPEHAVATYLDQRFAAQTVPNDLVQVLHQRTSGNPLFLINVVEELVRHDQLQTGGVEERLVEDLEAVSETLPASLRQLIEQQFGQLDSSAQSILEAASVAGAEFATAAVAAGVEEDVEAVEAQCALLSRQSQFVQNRGLATWPDGTVSERYGFVHAMYQEVLYDRVSASRRARLHQQIGQQIEAGFGAETQDVASELAVHFERGRDIDRAVHYLHKAGENTLKRSAPHEAIRYLTRGLELLERLPQAPERTQHELMLYLTLGPPLIATKGYGAPEAERVYAHARELCEQVGSPLQRFRALWGSRTFYFLRGDLRLAFNLAQQLLDLAQAQHDVGLLLQGHASLGTTLFNRGELSAARLHLTQALDLYDPQEHHNHAFLYGHHPAMACLIYEAITLWISGYPDQAVTQSRKAIDIAQSHPFSLAFALNLAATIHLLRRDVAETRNRAEAVVNLSTQQGLLQFLGMGVSTMGWTLVQQGDVQAGLDQLHKGLEIWRATGAGLGLTHQLASFAVAYGKSGQIAEGLSMLDEALTLVEKNEERVNEAELHRLKGELVLQQSIPEASRAESHFHQSLQVARAQEAKSWELRTAVSLGRLWQQQGKGQEAYNLLAPVYEWFTEGFDTADLLEAKALLAELSG